MLWVKRYCYYIHDITKPVQDINVIKINITSSVFTNYLNITDKKYSRNYKQERQREQRYVHMNHIKITDIQNEQITRRKEEEDNEQT